MSVKKYAKKASSVARKVTKRYGGEIKRMASPSNMKSVANTVRKLVKRK